MSSEIALYYPYIHFQEDAWVKQAALYWDKVSRIVPEGYEHKLHDSDVVKKLKEKDDAIIDRTPSHTVVRSVSQELLYVLNTYGDALQAHLSPDSYLDSDSSSLAYIYHTKMDHELVDALVHTGLGTFRDWRGDGDTEWLGVHPKVGHAYMTALASSMGSRGSLSVVSDNPHFAVAGCGFPIRQLFANLIEVDDAHLDAIPGAQAKSALGIAAIERVLPADIDSVPIEKIIEFRRESIKERARYREAVANATANLADITDSDALRDHLEVSGAQIHASVEKLEGKMNSLLGDTALSVVGVSKDLPQLATVAITALGISVANPFVAAAGFAFNMFNAVRDKRRENDELREQPYAYLVALRETVSLTGFLDRVRVGARKLLLE